MAQVPSESQPGVGTKLSLRRALLLASAVGLVASLVLVASNLAPGWWLLVNSCVLGLAVLFERRGYDPRAPDTLTLRRTGERFLDPTSGELVEVWEDPGSGARRHAALSQAPTDSLSLFLGRRRRADDTSPSHDTFAAVSGCPGHLLRSLSAIQRETVRGMLELALAMRAGRHDSLERGTDLLGHAPAGQVIDGDKQFQP